MMLILQKYSVLPAQVLAFPFMKIEGCWKHQTDRLKVEDFEPDDDIGRLCFFDIFLNIPYYLKKHLIKLTATYNQQLKAVL